MFGTYEPESEPVIFGMTKPINSVNPWKVHVAEATRMTAKFRALKRVRAKWRLIVSGPEVIITE